MRDKTNNWDDDRDNIGNFKQGALRKDLVEKYQYFYQKEYEVWEE